MKAYRKKQKEKPHTRLALEEADPWKELETLLGHSVEVHTSKHGFRHVHLSEEDIAKVQADTLFGRKVGT